MATIVLIHEPDGTYRPAVPGEIMSGQIFQWIRNGVLSDVLKATGQPKPIYNHLNVIQNWEIDALPVNSSPTPDRE